MTSDFISERPARESSGPKPSKKLYSIPALLRDRVFTGKFETSAAAYEFSYAPKSASLTNGKLELTGSLSLSSARGVKREVNNVRATLKATQGGLGAVPGAIQSRASASSAAGLPLAEATGAHGFVGVMYYRIAPLDARSLGVSLDLRNVQLNVRLAPVSEVERGLQVIFSDVVAAVNGEKPDLEVALEQIARLNRLLSQT